MALSELNRAERDRILSDYNEATAQLLAGAARNPPISMEEESALQRRRSDLRQEYFDRLPRVTLSRCPFCGQQLDRAFDPWGFDGFWWQSGKVKPYVEPEACPHFAVLTGAVNLNGLPPQGGAAEARPGPEVPYVIPRVLELPTMVAVISALEMRNGYTAYPIAYFAETMPPPGTLTQAWTKTQYDYRDEAGRWRWQIKTDPWDFDLLKWVERGKLKWIAPGDEDFMISQQPPAAFPYDQLTGRRAQLIIKDDRLTVIPPPQNEDVDPFNE